MNKPLPARYSTDLDRVQSQGLDERSWYLRRLVFRALEKGGRGHIGSTLSLVEIIRVLYDDVLRYRPSEPKWEGRDRFVLSKGHGCLALYVVLADKGFFPIAELDRFCRFESILGGHAAACADKHRLGNLTAIIDYNKIQSAGSVFEIQNMEPLADKWASFGFQVFECNGHDVGELRRVLAEATRISAAQPRVVICHTVKGKGVPEAENNAEWHHRSNMSDDVLSALRTAGSA